MEWIELPVDRHRPILARFSIAASGVQILDHYQIASRQRGQRERSVSEDVMRKMAEKLKPPVFEEGFAKITVVRVKSAG